MTDDKYDNIVDVTGQLSEPDLHLCWRGRLPQHYAKHLDALKAQQDAVKAMRRTLTAIHNELCKDVRSANFFANLGRVEEDALERILGALVLLECAEERLMHALPVEMMMSSKELRQQELERGQRR
jgi:hypothetical protein